MQVISPNHLDRPAKSLALIMGAFRQSFASKLIFAVTAQKDTTKAHTPYIEFMQHGHSENMAAAGSGNRCCKFPFAEGARGLE